MNNFQDEHLTGLMLLRLAVLFSFFIGAVSVLLSFAELFTWFYFVYGGLPEDPEWAAVWQKWETSKLQILLLNLYNILVWNTVVIFTIWLFRLHEWARRILSYLLGFDMVFTVAHLLWLYFRNELQVESPGFMILLNTIQVAVIVLLSHPEVIRVTQTHQALRKTMEQKRFDKDNY